jgi:hypothetical protein
MVKTANFVGINLPWAPEILAQTYPGKATDPVLGIGLVFLFCVWYVGFFRVRSAFGHLLLWLSLKKKYSNGWTGLKP